MLSTATSRPNFNWLTALGLPQEPIGKSPDKPALAFLLIHLKSETTKATKYEDMSGVGKKSVRIRLFALKIIEKINQTMIH